MPPILRMINNNLLSHSEMSKRAEESPFQNRFLDFARNDIS